MDHGDRPSPPDEAGPGRIVTTIRIPALPEYVAVLRAACEQLAPRLGYTPEETADLGLAVDEACGFLLRNCIPGSGVAGGPAGGVEKDGGLVAAFVVEGQGLHIRVKMQADIFFSPDDDEFGLPILAALVDDFSWRVDDSAVRVELRKLRADGPRRSE